jgi:hypothetical protein
MTNLELRDMFKYKSFMLSTDDNSIIRFELDQVIRDEEKICNYNVEYKNGKCIINFTNPSHFGPFLNIEVILLNGNTFLINEDISKLKNSQRIIMKEVHKANY